MITCDVCKEKVGDSYIQISVRGEHKSVLYELGLESTYFDVCSPDCGLKLLEQIKALMPKMRKDLGG